jgi:diphthamide synthase (EF-2-diphthine--ammonia ligase)
LDALAEAIALASLTVVNDRGDTVANPLLTEHRMQASTLTQLLRTLGVTSLEEISSGGVEVEDVLAKARAERLKRQAGA